MCAFIHSERQKQLAGHYVGQKFSFLLAVAAQFVSEGRKLDIPVVAIVDTNCSPSGVDYIIPGNDDASRAIALYCDLAARAALDGMSAQLGAAGVDLGEMEEAPVEEAVAEDAPAEEAATEDAQA